MHILDDTARAGQYLLLQKQAAQLQCSQPNPAICRAHQRQPGTPEPSAHPRYKRSVQYSRAQCPSRIQGSCFPFLRVSSPERQSCSRLLVSRGAQRELHMSTPFPVVTSQHSLVSLLAPICPEVPLSAEQGKMGKGGRLCCSCACPACFPLQYGFKANSPLWIM